MKKPTITPHLKAATEIYLMWLAHAEVIRPIVEGYKQEVLDKHAFFTDDSDVPARFQEEPKRITSPKQTYRMNRADWEHYHGLVKEEERAAGFYYSWGICPLLIAENSVIRARQAMIDSAEYITGIAYDSIWKLEHYDEAARIISGLVLSLCPELNGDHITDQRRQVDREIAQARKQVNRAEMAAIISRNQSGSFGFHFAYGKEADRIAPGHAIPTKHDGDMYVFDIVRGRHLPHIATD